MEIMEFLYFACPFIIVVYLSFLLFIRPTKRVVRASLLGGVVTGLINIVFDLLAYYAHWWHYTLNGLILHLPLPFYLSTILIYGGIVYLLVWRFWKGRFHWLALALLVGVPIFGIVRDITGWMTNTSYSVWDNALLAVLGSIAMWVLMFYMGFLVFRWLAPTHAEASDAQKTDVEV